MTTLSYETAEKLKDAGDHTQDTGPTPEEAVAHLYLALYGEKAS